MSKLLLFDFDGTIVDSKAVYYKSIESHLSNLGFNKKKIDSAIDIGLNISETLKKLGFGFISRIFIKKKIINQVLKHVNEIKKCRDADHIKNIKARKILISNSLKEFIFPVLRHLKLKQEFSEIYGAEDFDSKEKFIAEYLKNRKIDRKEVYYIGDRVADIKLARKIGIKVIIVSGKCSWNDRKDLVRAEPDFIVSNLDDIKKLF